MKNKSHPLKNFLILWSTQSVSQLGSSITTFALTICSYAPYVLMSIFAGALTDRLDKKKIMLVCDLFAVFCTIAVFALFRTNHLMVWHLYALNIISGLMNTVQQPASEVAMTLIIPEQYYQKTSALRSLSRSLISILNPLIATALYAFAGLNGVVAADVGSFIIAFTALLFFVSLPKSRSKRSENIFCLAKEGLRFLKRNPMILTLLLFLSGINLVSSAFDAVCRDMSFQIQRAAKPFLASSLPALVRL